MIKPRIQNRQQNVVDHWSHCVQLAIFASTAATHASGQTQIWKNKMQNYASFN